MSLLTYEFMVRALLGAVFTGLAAPAVGTYLVQRRLALMGDGIGHIAVTGVALGLLTGASPTITAVIVAVIGAVVIEVIRESGRTSGDVALALLFYGGIAGGVLLTGLAGAERRDAEHLPVRLDHHDLVDRRVGHDRAGGGRRRHRGRPVAPAVRRRAGPGVRAGRGAQRPRLQPAGLRDGRRHRHGRDAHRGPAAGQRADGGAGRHVPAGHPGLPQHAVRRDGARPARVAGRRRAVGAHRVRTVAPGVAPGATIVLLALAGFAAAYPVGVWLRRRQRLASPFAEAGDDFPLGEDHTAVPEDHGHTHGPDCGHSRCGTATTSTTSTTVIGTPYTEVTMTSTDAARSPAPGDSRPTRQRRAVAAALQSFDDFRSAQDIHELLRRGGENVGLSTVYRTLQALADGGEVDMLRTEDGEAVYRRCSARHHHHLVCRTCGRTVEVEGPDRRALGRRRGRRARLHRREPHARDLRHLPRLLTRTEAQASAGRDSRVAAARRRTCRSRSA